jgi:phage repressor protein C with HTH and peptisase S24 domain
MLPLYRDGDILIVEPGAQIRRGDRVVVRSREGEVMAKVLNRQTPKSVELISINPDHPNRSSMSARSTGSPVSSGQASKRFTTGWP